MQKKSFHWNRNKEMEKAVLGKTDWIINIENAAYEVKRLVGEKTVEQVFRKYGASSADDLNPIYYSDVFGELDFITHDADD